MKFDLRLAVFLGLAFLLLSWRIALNFLLTPAKKSFYGLKARVRRGLWRSRDGWSRLTAGMEIEELWVQFKTEATESSRLYKQDASGREGKREKPWKQSIKISQTLIGSVLRKALACSPFVSGSHDRSGVSCGDRVSLLIVFTQELEFTWPSSAY